MATIHLTGRITESGKLEIDLPDGLPPGEVQVTINLTAEVSPREHRSSEEQSYAAKEISEALTFRAATAEEILSSGVVGSWAHLGITDSAAWVQELRRKIERRQA